MTKLNVCLLNPDQNLYQTFTSGCDLSCDYTDCLNESLGGQSGFVIRMLLLI